MSLETSTREFSDTLRRYVQFNRRERADLLNDRAARLATAAIRTTQKADAESVRKLMSAAGSIAQQVRFDRKTGKVRAGKIVIQHTNMQGERSVAARIIQDRLKKQSKPMIWGRELQEAADKLVNARLRAIGYVRSGWIGAYKALEPSLRIRKPRNPKSGMKEYGPPRGTATQAKPAVIVEAEIVNQVASKLQKGDPAGIRPVAEEGLALALQAETANMVEYMERKMQQGADQFSSRSTLVS